jgi:putative membrane protein
MKRPSILIAVISGTFFLISCANQPADDSKKQADSTNTANIDSAKLKDTSAVHPVHMADLKPDADFAVAAADGGMLEVALGKMAMKKGSSSAVRKLGALMVTDHSKANLELNALADEKHIAIPATMSEKCQKAINDLEQKNANNFNKDYVDLMIKDHKDDIDEFKKEAEKGNDTRISGWAKNKIPVLEHHLMMAEEAQKKLEQQSTQFQQ